MSLCYYVLCWLYCPVRAPRYLLAERDVLFNQAQLKYLLDKTTYFQYIYQNGPVSLFLGYVWTLDVFVDFAWAQFGSLKITLVILLALEAVVQVAGMIYEFILLKAANSEAMKRCSVLLALPSATVRGVASRQLQVRLAGNITADHRRRRET